MWYFDLYLIRKMSTLVQKINNNNLIGSGKKKRFNFVKVFKLLRHKILKTVSCPQQNLFLPFMKVLITRSGHKQMPILNLDLAFSGILYWLWESCCFLECVNIQTANKKRWRFQFKVYIVRCMSKLTWKLCLHSTPC